MSLRPTGVFTPQTTSCCWRSMKACSQPPFRPSSPGGLPHFKRKWIILWNEWRHVRQWQTHTRTHAHAHINIYTQYADNCGQENAREKKYVHISIKILPTDTEKDVQIECKVFRSPSCLFESLTECPSPPLFALLPHCYCHSKNIYCAMFTSFYKQIKFHTTMSFLFLYSKTLFGFQSSFFIFFLSMLVVKRLQSWLQPLPTYLNVSAYR